MELFLDNILYVVIFFIVLSVVFFFLKKTTKKHNMIDNSNTLTSEQIQIKLRAYERLTLFLDRIEPVRMLNRLQLHTVDIITLDSILIKNIITEYEYNVSQQIYVSDELWHVIELAKNTIINNIINVSNSLDKNATIDEFVQVMLQFSKENNLIIKRAHKLLKKEARAIA